MNIWNYKRRWNLKADQLSEFCRHVGAMASAGIPLAKSMEILQKGTDEKKLRNLYGELGYFMEQGCSFSHALEQTGRFPELFLNMFLAAEASGTLGETAKRMSDYYKKEHELRKKIQSATLYPKILCIVSLFVLLMVVLVVIPTVEPIFAKMELPVLTKWILNFSHAICQHWRGILFCFLILYLIGRGLMKTHKVRRWIDYIKINLPVVGKSFRVIYTARFARSESGLYSSGLPIVEGLKISARTIGNLYLEDQIHNVIQRIQGGATLSRAMESADGFDGKLASVMFVGEETGTLDDMLETISDSYELEAELAFNRLAALIEPCMILVMGLVIGLILMGIMMPMWSMYEYIG